MIRRGLGDRECGRAGDRGSVVAEFAVALPVVVLVLLLGVAALNAGARHVRLEDAVADAARLAARGEARSRVLDAVSHGVPGAHAVVAAEGDLVCVEASASAGIAGIVLRARSCALAGGF